MLLSKNATAYLVMPAEPTVREQFAADELVKYLNRICGVCLIETKELQLPAIVLGSPDRNPCTAKYISEADFDKVCPGPEGIYLQSFGEEILVVSGSKGDCERGTIYAVYELLERYFGASFAGYNSPAAPMGEWIPKTESLSIEGISYCKAACDLTYRTACIQYADFAGDVNKKLNVPFFDWLSKNRYNRIFTWSSCYEDLKPYGVLEEAERRGIRFAVGHHSAPDLFLPPYGNKYFPEHYFETHPEYYKLMADGKRYGLVGHMGQWTFCSRNEGFIVTFADNIKSWLRQNPMVDILSLFPKDGIDVQCCCPQCAPYSKVENYLHVINRVAELVSRDFPNVKIEILAYVDLFECPENVKIHPSVQVQEATWHDTGLRSTGKPDGSCLLDTFFEKNLLKWKAAGADVTYYDYHMAVYSARQRYIPMADEMKAIYSGFVKKGICGSATQIECFNLWNHLFNYYCFGRTLYDTSLSMEDNYFRFGRIFGEGAEEVEQVIRLAEATLDGQEPLVTSARWLIRNIDKETVYGLYEKALAKTTDPIARNNIRLMRMEFRYTDLETQQPEVPDLDENYQQIKQYAEPTGELHVMSQFDSFYHNNPGFGITIPAAAPENPDFQRGVWYTFDN